MLRKASAALVLLISLLLATANAKTFLGICSMLRNEKKWLRAWIEWHLMVGVNHFFILDDNSDDGSAAILEEYAAAGLLTLLSSQARQELVRDGNNASSAKQSASSETNLSAVAPVEAANLTQRALDLNLEPSEDTGSTTQSHALSHVIESGEVMRFYFCTPSIQSDSSSLYR
jgi:hypothetical protein